MEGKSASEVCADNSTSPSTLSDWKKELEIELLKTKMSSAVKEWCYSVRDGEWKLIHVQWPFETDYLMVSTSSKKLFASVLQLFRLSDLIETHKDSLYGKPSDGSSGRHYSRKKPYNQKRLKQTVFRLPDGGNKDAVWPPDYTPKDLDPKKSRVSSFSKPQEFLLQTYWQLVLLENPVGLWGSGHIGDYRCYIGYAHHCR